MSNNLKFEIGFWIPFGHNCDQSPSQILQRKQEEIKKNDGWTLWSFRRRKTLDLWFKEILKNNTDNVFVFCSNSDFPQPNSGCKECGYYKKIDESSFSKIPKTISVPIHSNDEQAYRSAFIVKEIIYPYNSETESIEWWKKDKYGKTGDWEHKSLPTRGEYLIRPGAGKSMRGVIAVLQLERPFLAEIQIKAPHL